MSSMPSGIELPSSSPIFVNSVIFGLYFDHNNLRPKLGLSDMISSVRPVKSSVVSVNTTH